MARIQLILTLDYEIHGNGEGSPRDLMVRPTDRLLEMLNTVDGKLTLSLIHISEPTRPY